MHENQQMDGVDSSGAAAGVLSDVVFTVFVCLEM